MQVFETDKRIRQLFKEPDYIQQLNKVMLENWENEEEKISNEISKSIANMNAVLVQMAQEPDINKKSKLQKELQKLQSNINEQISNVQSISSSLGITVQFIQDVKKDVLRVESKINDIQNSINQVGSDIKYLKGKSVIELFQIRMNKIMHQQLYTNANKVYVPIKTKEKLIQDNREDEQTELFSESLLGNGEINEFIWKQQKDSMLIHGSAGSGKSTAARRIEEFIWGIYQKNMGTQDYIPIIPVFVVLPSLKDPLYNAIEETLKSDNYRFDDRQLLQLKEDVESNKIRLVFILDSYDEINQTYIGQNLLKTNSLSKWRCKKDINTFPKVITTTRNEIFNVKDYWSWFISESNSLKHFKEIRLLKFDESQIDDYIEQYCRLTLKQLIIEVYEESSQIESSKYLKQYEQITSDILHMLFGQKSQLERLSQDDIGKFVLYLKKCQVINEPIEEEPLKLLRIKLIQLWGQNKYKELVIQLKLMSLLETPFMIEIVLQVLPKINSQRTDKSFIKENFVTRYVRSNQNQNQEEVQSIALTMFQQLEKSNVFKQYNVNMNKWQVSLVINKLMPNIDTNQLIAESLIVNSLTQFDIYLEFLTQYFEMQLQKQKALGMNIDLLSALDELWRFAQNLAMEMTTKQLTCIEYQPKGLVFKDNKLDWKDFFFNEIGDEGVYKKMFRNCMPLTQKFKFHSFMHKSIQEFLVARKIIDQLTKGELELINELKLSKEFGITQFIVNKFSRDYEIQDQLFMSVSKCNLIGASNIIFLLNFMNFSFEDKNLTGLELEDITLQQANFYNSQLTNSKWTNVNISSCNFNQANLTGVVWKGIYINELPQLNPQSQHLMQIEYINSTQILLSLGSLNKYENWTLESYNTKQGAYKTILSEFTKFSVSIDEQYLVGVNDSQIILYSLVLDKQLVAFNQPQEIFLEWIIFTQDENIVIGGGNSGAYLIELQNQIKEYIEPLLQITDQRVKQIVHQNNQIILSYQEEGMTSVYDINKKTMIQKQKKYTIFNYIQTLAASSEYLAVSGDDSGQIEILLFNTSEHKDNLLGHKDRVNILKFRDIETLVSSSVDHTIKMWNVKTSMLMLTISVPMIYTIYTITLAKSGIMMAGTSQRAILQWDLKMQGSYLNDDNRRQGHSTIVTSIAFSIDGTLLASGSDSGIIKLWETKQNNQLGADIVSSNNPTIRCLCFNNDTSILFSGGTDYQLIGRDLINFEIIYQINSYGVEFCEIQIVNQNLVCRLKDHTVRIYDQNTLQFKIVFNYKNANDQLSLGYEDSSLNYQHQSKPQKLQQQENEEIICFDLVLIKSPVICYKNDQISFHNYLNSSTSRYNPVLLVKIVNKDEFLVWRIGSLEVWEYYRIRCILLGQVNPVNALSSYFLKDKQYYLTCDYYINIWQGELSHQWKILKKPNEGQIISMINSEELIMGGSEFGAIYIWNMIQGQLIKEIKNAHASTINAITINLQKQWLITTDSQSEVKFWDYSGGQQHNSFQTQQQNIKFVYMDQFVLITGTNTEIIIWNSETCQQLNKIQLNNEINHHIVYLPIEQSLYVSEKDYINRYPLSINAYASNIKFDTQSDFSCLAVSDTLIATGSANGSIFIYNSDGIKQGECIIGEQQSGSVKCLSMDDQMLSVLYKEGGIKVFNIFNREVIWKLQRLETDIITFSLLLKGGFAMYYNDSDNNLIIINVNDQTQQVINTKLKQLKGVVSRNNQYIATIGDDKYIRMYSQTTKGWGCSKMISLEPQMMCESALIKDAQVISHSGMDLIELFRESNAIKK